MGNYSILAIHGIGAGDGESRKGFSSNLRDLIFTDSAQRKSSWHECIWEDLNDNIDNQISSIVQQLLTTYRKDWIKGEPNHFKRIWKNLVIFCQNLSIIACAGLSNLVLDLGLDFVLYLDSTHGEKIRDRLRAMIHETSGKAQDGIILLAHSLGSVIAYDTLAESVSLNEPLPIKKLITFGSPLQWTFDLRKAESKPECALKSTGNIPWHNFYYKEDYVSLYKPLSTEIFPNVENFELTLPKSSSEAKSHCAYWTDINFANEIKKLVTS